MIYNIAFWIYLAFLVYMLLDCMRYEVDKGIWILVMIFLQGVGPLVYFFVRFLPRHKKLMANSTFGSGKELKRLQIAAHQIGNPYHHIQYADKLREVKKYPEALIAYQKALEKEPDNLQALWGSALCQIQLGQLDESEVNVRQILSVDPEYKFGDVSLALGRILVHREDWESARTHLERHVSRWRQPEGLFLLAQSQVKFESIPEARESLQSLIMDVESSPTAIAYQNGQWKRKAKHLLKQLPS